MVTFRRAIEDVVEASVASRWQLQNVTEVRAHGDLEAARSRTEALLADDPAFRSVVGASRIEYVLVDDYENRSRRDLPPRGRANRVAHRSRVIRAKPPKSAFVGVGLPQILPHSERSPCKSGG
jgi:hypothetical protein